MANIAITPPKLIGLPNLSMKISEHSKINVIEYFKGHYMSWMTQER